MTTEAQHAPPPGGITTEKAIAQQEELLQSLEESTHGAAARGHLATDNHGNPIIQFDKEAERRLRLKIDLFIIPTVSLLYLFCFIDRANIGNARLAGLEKDLKLEGYDYNAVLSTFYISYIIFEIPVNLACKWIGPGWFIPATSLGFGLCSIFTGLCRSIHSVSGVRFLLGMFEAGMLPGIAYLWKARKR